MDLKAARRLLKSISYSQRRNKISGRTIRSIDISEKDLIDIYIQQNGKCYWSGLSLDWEYNKIKHHPFAISVERLDNALGYTVDNICLCRRIFNLGRMAFPEAPFKLVMDMLKTEFKNQQPGD